ncbi:hypothetical protein [Lactiplantibacillus plantarum]|uniref:hypothetical protein n=1 Tax=Lactiplantibacillus plantarum TaxID=1590 RepID=UPI00265A9952|nr:hypothetical protein [Lactiplantibacillus plantarum]WKF83819.1 hypothetical protein QY876_05255 [Lactiplantibacillus plantarum]
MIQQAVVQVLSPIYEQVFSDNSYGFRPGRSAHDAIQSVTELHKHFYPEALPQNHTIPLVC